FQGDVGNFVQAEDCFRQSFAIWSQRLGPEHYGLLRVINQLAALYVETGQLAKAERLDLEGWLRRVEANPRAIQERVPLLQNLAMLDLSHGREERAEARFRKALDLTMQTGATPGPQQAVILNNLGLASLRLGRPEAAIQHLTRSLSLWEQLRGPAD